MAGNLPARNAIGRQSCGSFETEGPVRRPAIELTYVNDDREHGLAKVLDDLLRNDAAHALDVATAYVNLGAFELLQATLEGPDSVRLLPGFEPGGAGDLGLRQAMRCDLDAAPFDEATLQLVEAVIRFLRRRASP